ncbi:MAG: hypothetical protein EXR58_02010 [Chloroflexi bacterium]|nr:hypothetical protein [Chloroflexota bacterium]
MYKINTNEPFWWGLFMGGAGMIGMFLPVLILVFGLAIPGGAVPPASYDTVRLIHLLGQPASVGNLLVKVFLFGVFSLTFFHWAHRFRYLLFDLGLHGGRTAVEYLCYSAALAATIYTAVTLFVIA